MLGEIFSRSMNVAVCGNLGKSFSLLAVDNDYEVAITEVSSFQLEQTPYLHPKIAVITNITEDHIIRHKTMDEYAKIKFSISAHQNANDYLVLPYDDSLWKLSLLKTRANTLFVSAKQKVNGAYALGGKIYFQNEEICPVDTLENLKAYHNLVNALFTVCVSKLYGIKNYDIVEGLKNYKLQGHRLEYVGSVGNTRFFNDSKSTNVDSTNKALATMKGSTALILGGSDKGLSFNDLFEKMEGVIKICVIGEIADKIIQTARKYKFYDVEKFDSLEKAVVNAFLLSPDNLLLSPASASFGEFSSYKERGEKFREIVTRLSNGNI
jgi:UDP-N-acetylmuramoylalanine--D-glutamate ligase